MIEASIVKEFNANAKKLGTKLEQRYGVSGAGLLPAEILIPIGIKAFSKEQVAVVPNVSLAIALLDPGSRGTDLSRIFGDVNPSGVGTYENSSVVSAIAALSKTEQSNLQREFGSLYAYQIVIYGKQFPTGPIRYVPFPSDRTKSLLRDLSAEEVEIDRPQFAVDLGPGLVSFQRILPQKEVHNTRRFVMIDTNEFALAHIQTGYELFARLGQVPKDRDRLVAIAKPMTLGLQDLLRRKERPDLIMASMVHSAGEDELVQAFRLSRDLLRPGGLLAIQAPDQVKPGEANAQWFVSTITSIFGVNPIRQVPIETYVEATGEQHTGISALYKKE